MAHHDVSTVAWGRSVLDPPRAQALRSQGPRELLVECRMRGQTSTLRRGFVSFLRRLTHYRGDLARRRGRTGTILISPSALTLGMANLHIYDEFNHLYLAAFGLPSVKVFRVPVQDLAGTNHSSPALKATPLEDNQGIALIVTAFASDVLQSAVGEGGAPPQAHTLRTWIVHPSSSGKLSEYFAQGATRLRDRVFLHHSPAIYANHPLPSPWDEAYRRFERMYRVTEYATPPAALRQGAEVLMMGLLPCREGREAIGRYLASLGHPITHATWNG